MARPKKNRVLLTDNDVKSLKGFMKKKDTTQTLYSRCRVLINLDENHLPAMTYDQCIEACFVSRATVAKIVSLFASGGIDAVLKINRNINSDNANRKVDGRIGQGLLRLPAVQLQKDTAVGQSAYSKTV